MNDKEINFANTHVNISQDATNKKGYNKKRNFTKKSQEVSCEVVSNEGLMSQEPSATNKSEDEVEVLPKDMLIIKEWVMKVNVGM